ncbi:MAG: YhcH/YjgK/YiaL family protein [Chitinophagaceae bacterium]|nr:YhcH/YjgK/YiaL family protein [Chitinophagaceae bacterium]
MIVDHISRGDHYASLHPLFGKAFEYISKTDLGSLEVGKFDIDGDRIRGIVSDAEGKTSEESVAKFECHNAHIDIQVCIRGKETLGWKPRGSCVSPRGEYNAEKDVLFYDDAPDMFFGLTDNQFVIFYPEDVHAPMIGGGMIKKLVIKVKI